MTTIKEILLKTLEELKAVDLKTFQWYLIDGVEDFVHIPKSHLENADRCMTVDMLVATYGLSKAVDVTLAALKKMNQNQLAEELESKIRQSEDRCNTLANNLTTDNVYNLKVREKKFFKQKFAQEPNRPSLEEDHLFLQDTYTDLCVIKGCTGGVNTEHEFRQVEDFYPKSKDQIPVKFRDLFQVPSDQTVPGVKVLTIGIAGVGKTHSVKKFILDWAEDKSNQDIDFILFLPFCELNVIKDKQFNLLGLLKYFHHNLNGEIVKEMLRQNVRMIFIFDGLDESNIDLEFNQEKVSDVTEETTLDKLIINLIKGELLPSAFVWVTSRPAAADRIPHRYFREVTEICGFSNSQKDEYFKNRIRDQDKACRIITHIRSVRSLHILCHIPAFCNISANVILEMLENIATDKNSPTTLTKIYTRFLVHQTKQKNEKYASKSNKDTAVPPNDTDSLQVSDIKKLGKLAFLQLLKMRFTFNKKDLEKCDIDFDRALVHSGVCTRIFSKDEEIFSFVHLSFQEFLAAVFVFLVFVGNAQDPCRQTLKKMEWKVKPKLADNLKKAVDKAMESKNGNLDLFLRFLMGLQSNQKHLKCIMPELEINEENLEETKKHILSYIGKTTSSEKILNLFHCMSELKDSSLSSYIEKHSISDDITKRDLSSQQWAAEAFALQMSKETLEVFDLKKYRQSDEGLRRLLPVVKITQKALLDNCNLNWKNCDPLATVCSSILKELDLSNNDLQDSGVKQLCSGLKSVHCKLEILRLSGCMITNEGCSFLDLALNSNPLHLKELDLTYNNPGESGVKQLIARREDPHCRLKSLWLGYAGKNRMKPGPRKYACKIRLDPNTAHRNLAVSKQNRKVVYTGEQQPYPDHPDRFDTYEQVLSTEDLTGRCYWEAEWSDEAEIAVTYKGIDRKGNTEESQFGWNEKSWSLVFSNDKYSAWHNQKKIELSDPPFRSNRVGVYLNWPAGTLSFYGVSSAAQNFFFHLHTFHSTFTEPLYAGFRVINDFSLHLCDI